METIHPAKLAGSDVLSGASRFQVWGSHRCKVSLNSSERSAQRG